MISDVVTARVSGRWPGRIPDLPGGWNAFATLPVTFKTT